jgi:hypothetical protein
MTILSCPFPSNVNPLSSNGFRFGIQKIPEIEFFCQSATIPGLTLNQHNLATPLSNMALPGATLDFTPLDIEFMVDAEMKNYLSIWNWMIGLGFPETWNQYTDFLQTDSLGSNTELSKNLSDGTLSILNNSFVPIQTIQFVGLFPISINTLTLQATATDVNYLICSASFQYSHYKFLDN